MFTWTVDVEDRLRAMWRAGWTGGMIAAQIGCGLTRNAVLGKAGRMGLSKDDQGGVVARPTPDKRVGRSRVRKSRAVEIVQGPPPVLSVHPCMWPTTETKPYEFCGKPSLRGKSYCPGHHDQSQNGKRGVGAGFKLEPLFTPGRG